MNLASFFMFVHEHYHFSEATLKCDIMRKEDNYKYLAIALYTHHFRERFTFCFFFLQVCFWAIYDKTLKFSFIGLASPESFEISKSQNAIFWHYGG